jgi:predicted SAM-dependent methyltransferase
VCSMRWKKKLGSAIGYLTKQRSPQAAWRSPLLMLGQTKALLKKVLGRARLLKAVSAARARLSWTKWHFRRGFGNCERLLIKSYLANTGVPKLHIGCGANVLPGWLNADYYPDREDILHLDATKPFGLPDNSFSFVFSEHMIEHIPYIDALSMLRECHRVLRPGGRIRISTPDLAFVVGLYISEKSEQQKSYIKWSTSAFVSWAPYPSDAFVINNFVRNWGHQFIYDEKTLRSALSGAGFNNLIRCNLQESVSEVLSNLENEQRMPGGFLRLETVTIEAQKL